MVKTKAVELKGKPGNWVALDPRTYKKIAEGKTLEITAKKAKQTKVKNPVFTQIPKDS